MRHYLLLSSHVLNNYEEGNDNFKQHVFRMPQTFIKAVKHMFTTNGTCSPPMAYAHHQWHMFTSNGTSSPPMAHAHHQCNQELPTLTSMKSGSPRETSLAYSSSSSVLNALTKVKRQTVLWPYNYTEEWSLLAVKVTNK